MDIAIEGQRRAIAFEAAGIAPPHLIKHFGRVEFLRFYMMRANFTVHSALKFLRKGLCASCGLLSLVSLLFCVTAQPAAAQQPSGGLQGQVRDQLGGLIVGASVTTTGPDGLSEATVTDKSGSYAFRHLVPGRYSVHVEARGFAVYEKTDVTVLSQHIQALDVRMEIALAHEEVTALPEAPVDVEPSRNTDAIVLRGDDLNMLPDDPAALESALQALAAAAGPGNAQIQVDGLTGGRLPSKASIREIRINQNPFNAENDAPGGARIDILTKPGADQFHGSAFVSLSDESLNARSPFAGDRAPYHYGLYGGTFSGPVIPKRASFFLDFQRRDEKENGIVNARGLNEALNFAPLVGSFAVPRNSTTFSPRFDYQLNPNHTLVARYSYTRTSSSNLGVGELSLPERAYGLVFTQHNLQLTETAVVNQRMINETRFQFAHESRRWDDENSAPSIIVQESFLAGGAGVGSASRDTNRYELLNYTTMTAPDHIIRFGARLRRIHILDVTGENFNGAYVFAGGDAPLLDAAGQMVLGQAGRPSLVPITSLERYQRTLLLQRQGLSPARIRELGGGPSQLSITVGNPQAEVTQTDAGMFFQDQWQVRPNVTLTMGLRYEAQTHLDDWSNLAPRLSLAWSPGGGKGSAGKGQSSTVLRVGYGTFYERFSESNTLQALRYDGERLRRFIITEPSLLDYFPSVPSAGTLTPFVQQQTKTRIAGDLRAARTDFYAVSFERQLPHRTSVFVSATEFRTRHTLRQRNVNAPQPVALGDLPGSGVRPFVNMGEIFLIESSNAYINHQLVVGFRSQLNPRFSVFTNYLLTKTENGGESLGLPANSYDLESEWGRAAFDVRHRFYVGGTINISKLKVALNPFVIAFSSRPFNIITGRDNNGDGIFTDRPSFATELTAPQNLRRTQYGDFDLNPTPGTPLIPRNYGRGPGFFSINLGVSRTFNLSFAETASSSRAAVKTQDAGKAGSGASVNRKQSESRFKLTLSVEVQNLLNHANFAPPVGNLSSPLFGRSTRTLGAYGFDASGGSVTPAFNRRVEAQVRLNF